MLPNLTSCGHGIEPCDPLTEVQPWYKFTQNGTKRQKAKIKSPKIRVLIYKHLRGLFFCSFASVYGLICVFDIHEQFSCERTDSKEQEVQEIFDEVKRIIELQLTETQRQVLWMRDYEGYSFAEIADAMDITEENARQILSRARRIVRETYKRLN